MRETPHCHITLLTICLVVMSLLSGATAFAQSKSNLDMFQKLLGKISSEIVKATAIPKGDSVSVAVQPTTESWLVETAISEALRENGAVVFLAHQVPQKQGKHLELNGQEMAVRYEDMFREGFLGAQKVKRSTSASLSFRLEQTATGEVTAGKTLQEVLTDTIDVDEIPLLESPALPFTRGQIPSDSFLDKVVEPFVIIGAAGVAIYLFFTIRS